MVNRVDGIILGVGVVVLAASIVGVVLYEDEGETTWAVSWTEGEASSHDELTDSGGPGEYEFTEEIPHDRLATVTFTVDVTANGGQLNDDAIDVSVEGPDGQTGDCSFSITASAAGQSGSGTCDAETSVQDAPSGVSISAENRTAAEERAIEQTTLTAGNGNWTITVAIDGGTELQDPSYSIAVLPQYTLWEPRANMPGDGGLGGGPG